MNLVQRMYCLVLYNISPIQQGIQSLHAVVDYQLLYGNTPEYHQWSQEDKTVIILNGGTSKTMMEHVQTLFNLGVNFATFCEPDLYGGMTAICFLVDERIWDKEKYPDYFIDENRIMNTTKILELIGKENIEIREFLSKFRLA